MVEEALRTGLAVGRKIGWEDGSIPLSGLTRATRKSLMESREEGGRKAAPLGPFGPARSNLSRDIGALAGIFDQRPSSSNRRVTWELWEVVGAARIKWPGPLKG